MMGACDRMADDRLLAGLGQVSALDLDHAGLGRLQVGEHRPLVRLSGFGNEPIFRGSFIGRDGVRMFQIVAVHPGGEGRREVTDEVAWRVEELTG